MMRYQYVEIYMFTLGIMGLAMMAVRLLSLSTQVLCREYLSKSLGWMHKGAVSTFLVGTLHSLILHSKTMADLAAAGFTNAGLFQLTPMLSYIVGTGFGTAGFIFLFTLDFAASALYLLGLGAILIFFCQHTRAYNFAKWGFSLGLLLSCQSLLVFVLDGVATTAFEGWGGVSSANLLLLLLFMSGGVFFFLVRSEVALMLVLISLVRVNIFTFTMTAPIVLGMILFQAVYLFYSVRSSHRSSRASALYLLLVTILAVGFSFVFSQEIASFLLSLKVSMVQVTALYYFLTMMLVLVFTLLLWPLSHMILSLLVPIPLEKEPQKLTFIGSRFYRSPELALELAEQEIKKMAALVDSMLHLTRSSLEGSVNEEDSKRLTKYENVTDNIAHELMLYLGSIEEEGLTSNQVERASRYRFFYQLLESIADHCNAIHCLSEKKEVQFEEPVKTLFLSRFEYLTGLFEESFVDWSSSRPESINLEGLRVEDIEVLRSSQEEVRQVSLHFIYLEYDIIRLVKATAS